MQPQHGSADLLTFNQTALCGIQSSLALLAISTQQCEIARQGVWVSWGGHTFYSQLVDCSSLPECVAIHETPAIRALIPPSYPVSDAN